MGNSAESPNLTRFELWLLLHRRLVQVECELGPRRRIFDIVFGPEAEAKTHPVAVGLDGAVAAHVPAEGLPDGELEPADGAAVQLGLGRLGGLAVREAGLLVAGPVPAERLEGREPPVAGLALERLLRRGQGRVRRAGAAMVVAGEEQHEVGHVGAVGQPDHLLGLLPGPLAARHRLDKNQEAKDRSIEDASRER
jgi:hypothetical protein